MMKKSLILVLMGTLLPSVTFAQLKVNSTGKVLIGSPTNTSASLSIKHSSAPTTSEHASFIDVEGCYGLRVDNNYLLPNSSMGYGIKAYGQVNTSNIFIGIEGYSKNFSTSDGKAMGVRGVATVNDTGTAYGVYGALNSQNGTGIYGSASSIFGQAISGRYAGYFDGNVKVTGTIDGTLVSSSDARLKEDVQGLDTDTRGKSVLDALESLTPVSFRYKQQETVKNEPVTEDGEEFKDMELPNPVMEKEHFGLIAQELQEVYPNLVYEKDDGYLAVNYVELVPVLMQAIKELKAKVESLESVRADRSPLLGGGSGGSDTASLNDSSLPLREETEESPYMNQNVPNPFTEKTDIAIYLPESVQTATLYIYDLSGKQLEQHPVTGRGNTVMTIHADRMDAGMYVYSLIADKRVVMAKKMVVVK